MEKRYISRLETSIRMPDGKLIVFRPTVGGSAYVTSDKAEQAVLDSLCDRDLWVDGYHVPAEEKPAEAAAALKDVEEITNCPDAKRWLQEHGVTKGLNSREAMKESARKIGYNLVNL